jgi:hypothetical protein
VSSEDFRPRHPVYVISKGRASLGEHTGVFLAEDGIDHHIVVEPQEADAYIARFGEERVYVLPFSNLGQGSIPARNWCWEHAAAAGAERHWILDDNIRYVARFYRGLRHRINSGVAFSAAEDFTDRYTNVALTGFDYWMFGPIIVKKPFRLNQHVYSTILIRNDLPYRWRGRYNEDTDLCLQVLSGGWCTVQITAFLIHKMGTMQAAGGNTDELYDGDGRLKMARALERQWPGIVTTERRFNRPQHVVKANWRAFDTPLIRRPDLDPAQLDSGRYDGLVLRDVRKAPPEI